MLDTLARWHQTRYDEVVADVGCESLENYLYLEKNGQTCFIKLTNYNQKMKKASETGGADREYGVSHRRGQLHLRPGKKAASEEGDDRGAGGATCLHSLVPV